ncbi:uncharacterized protein LOC127720331 [Mytilus californianus]|uniref:uncharacterized protein LOC127720331 n=1 Tax=Mytilus californianus TaxID=6549 RepID=UPI0022453779|nr:uncharacterized protein LOC127720331 [Mytilus californianus]
MYLNCSNNKGFILLVFGIFLPCVTNGSKFTRRTASFGHFCVDGYAPDELFPYPQPFTCKPGPGRNVKCQNIRFSLKGPFQCPGYGYASGWEYKEGFKIIRCCEDPDIEYYDKDCTEHLNTVAIDGGSYRVFKGKVMTGFTTFDNGKTWYNNECSYHACRRYTRKH